MIVSPSSIPPKISMKFEIGNPLSGFHFHSMPNDGGIMIILGDLVKKSLYLA
jgi:hypothetical protein